MAHRFIVPDSSPPGSPGLSTPEKTPQIRGLPTFGEHPSTTPAGPPPAPPSSAPSFTPAGAPTESYLGSSIMRGVTNPRQQPSFGGGFSTDSPGRNLFGSGRGQSPANAPLGRSIMGGGSQRQPSGLSRGFSMNDDDALDEDAEGEDDDLFSAPPPGSLFRPSLGPGNNFGAAPDDTNNEIGRLLEKDMGFGGFGHGAGQEEESEEEESEEDEQEEEELPQLDSRAGEEEDADMFLNMRHDDRPYGQPALGEEDDLMMMHTPAATNKVRREAEALLRRSSAHQGLAAREKGHEYASIAKDLYSHAEVARLDEPTSVILKTEALVSRLYDEGVGAEDDEEKLDNSLASITYQLVKLWTGHVRSLDRPQEEDLASVGPGVHAAPFEKAAYVAHLLLRLHHTRYEDDEPDYSSSKAQPLPGVLLHWLQDSGYNPYPDQVDDVMRYQPSPACHSLFWQTVQNSLLRGDVAAAVALLRNAGWEHVRRGAGLDRERVYTGQSLENVERFVASTCDTLEQCPSQSDDWDIFDSNWTLFRIQARGTLDRMMLFAEGRDQTFQDPMGGGFGVQQSLSTMARKASSQLPWDVYENLQNIYGILLGDSEAIVGTAQDWCEATVGMFVWWDDGSSRNRSLRLPQHQNLLTASTASAATSRTNAEYLERLSGAFHAVLQSDLSPNAMNAVEVAVASVFEGNVEGVIGLLRTWSLPVACSVAEVASLGRWLPPCDASASGGRGGLPAGMVDAFDVEDLALLNISQPGPDELLGIKDDTLERYARDLAGIEQLSPQREGWEMAIEVLGRMDAPEKSEEIVGELLKDILATLDENSAATVDKMWTILNHLGMINFAEETAEVGHAPGTIVYMRQRNTLLTFADLCRHPVQRVAPLRRGAVVLRPGAPDGQGARGAQPAHVVLAGAVDGVPPGARPGRGAAQPALAADADAGAPGQAGPRGGAAAGPHA